MSPPRASGRRPVPPARLLDDLERWIDIPSVTGDEASYARAAGEALAAAGFEVAFDEVEPGRPNVVARRGAGRLLFSTHLDTVPPFLPVRRAPDSIAGRGACDAKGVFACMLEAARQLVAGGEEDLAFLLVVGEEVDHAGARHAARRGLRADWVLLGEPTELKLVTAQKGILRLTLHAAGRAAHSGYPERGESAIEKLLDALGRVRAVKLGRDPELGPALLNIGLVRGGAAANVVPASAAAELLFRTVEAGDALLERVRRAVGPEVEIEVGPRDDPLELHVVPGEPTAVAGFGTDAPYLGAIGPVVLAGPGSILDAHGPGEQITFDQLAGGVALYVRLARALLGAPPRPPLTTA